MATEGRIVKISSSSFRTPPTCCSCGAPQQTEIEAKHSQKSGNVTTTLRMSIPYCQPCAERAKSFKTKKMLAPLIPLAFALVIGGLVFAVPAIPLVAGLVIALVVGAGGSIGAAIGLRPPMPVAPATARGEGARILSFSDNNQVTLYCTNPAWGDAFAQANGVQPKAKSKGDGFLWGTILVAVLLVPGAAGGAWAVGHPSVYVDNPTADPLQIFVDGTRELVIQPNTHNSVSVGHGMHTFGWAKAGPTAPTTTVRGEVKVGEGHLYNPGKTACYWLIANAYGAASTAGLSSGPQPIQEFYHFKKVDTWFGENPQSIKVEKGGSGGTRVALQRSATCMQLVQQSCPLASREALVSCQRAATSDDAFSGCFDRAQTQCKGVAPPVPTTTPAATTVTPPPAVAKPGAKPAVSVKPAAPTAPKPPAKKR